MYLLELVEKLEGIENAYEALETAHLFDDMPDLDTLIDTAIEAVSEYEGMTREGNIYRVNCAIVRAIVELLPDEDIETCYEHTTGNNIYESLDDLIDNLKDTLSNEDLYYTLHNNTLEGYELYSWNNDTDIDCYNGTNELIDIIEADEFVNWLEDDYTDENNTQLFKNFLYAFDWLADYSEGVLKIINCLPLFARNYTKKEEPAEELKESDLLLNGDDEPVIIDHETKEIIKNA